MASRSIRRSSDILLVVVLVVGLERIAVADDSPSQTNPFTGNAAALKEGAEMYGGYCTGCHGGRGHGGKCPDLTDDIWIHGGSDAEVFLTVSKGVAGTEMRNFNVGLKPDEIWKIIAYVR